ncbi:MAG: fructose-bisphosphatase class III [Solobacterium sp.]|nr:fructose-bisphosphatase class III [Solobacterium sp.]
MATYVISDLHGCLEEFEAMLHKIKFSEYDELYIAGDICDRGRYPIPLLRLIMSYSNMHIIFGNHDEWLAKYAGDMITGKSKPSHLYYVGLDFMTWIHYNGGLITMDQFMDLELPVCYDIQEYLSNPIYYKELKIGKKHWLIVHAGVGSYCRAGVHISEVPVNELIWPHIGLHDNPFPDTTMVVGHMPTFLYGEQYAGKIIHGRNLYHIDCGCVFGRKLGCLRLEDEQEFYVDSTYPYVE